MDKGTKQTYKFKKENSIVHNSPDEYILSESEYCHLYKFFVTYSLCKSQSFKQRLITDYGWSSNSIVASGLKEELGRVLALDDNPMFVFTDKNDLRAQFECTNLLDGVPQELLQERAVVGRTNEDNKYYKLFHRIRNALAHGRYSLRINARGEKMVVMQDNDRDNVTARLVLKLETLLEIIYIVDIDRLLSDEIIEEHQLAMIGVS